MVKIKLIILVVIVTNLNWVCKTSQVLKTDALNRIIINRADTVYQFHITNPHNKNRKNRDDSYYFWFKPDTILVTKSGFDGRLLHGDYKVFYPNKNLREKGKFEYGLKVGEWKNWFENGELKNISNWHAGKKTGRFREFDSLGNTIRKGYYRNDELSGYLQEYSKDSLVTNVLYKNGEPVIQKANKDSLISPDTDNEAKQ